VDFNDYQVRAMRTAKYKSMDTQRLCAVLGLGGEAGEVQELFKKFWRKNDMEVKFDSEFRNSLKFELGDILWYVASLANSMGWDLDDLAFLNLAKLARRFDKGMIQDHD
jgi:NTP pyrophosphatase (non-canonical NTP hydrolase)